MPGNNVIFTGSWKFTANLHNVSYRVSGDAPTTYSNIPSSVEIAQGLRVSVENVLTTSETSRDGVSGTWRFNGWVTDNVTISVVL